MNATDEQDISYYPPWGEGMAAHIAELDTAYDKLNIAFIELNLENQRLRDIYVKARSIVYNAKRLGWCDADREYLEELLGGGENG
jgi:hypothetical protein